jgi:DNA-directed RNA polymerase sigma subunit (sigma70/sigma32)
MVASDVFKLRKMLGESSRRLVSVEFDELLTFAKTLNWSEDRLRKIVKASSVQTTHCFSLEADVGRNDGRDWTLGDTMTAPTTARTDDFRMTLDTALETRAGRNARIIRLRFGLEDGVEHTYTEIAQKVGLSPQRVCSVVNQELRYLKDARSLRAFKDGFEFDHK